MEIEKDRVYIHGMARRSSRASRDSARPLKILSDVLSDRASSIFMYVDVQFSLGETAMREKRKEPRRGLTFHV